MAQLWDQINTFFNSINGLPVQGVSSACFALHMFSWQERCFLERKPMNRCQALP